jgi:hypothetical protein
MHFFFGILFFVGMDPLFWNVIILQILLIMEDETELSSNVVVDIPSDESSDPTPHVVAINVSTAKAITMDKLPLTVWPSQSSATEMADETAIKSPKRKPKLIKYEPLVKGDHYRGVGYDDYCCLCGGNEFTFGPFVYYSKPRTVVTYIDLEKGVMPEPLPDFVSDETDRELLSLHCGCDVHTYCFKNARKKHKRARCPPNEHDTVMVINNLETYIVYGAIIMCAAGVPLVIGLVFLLDYIYGFSKRN